MPSSESRPRTPTPEKNQEGADRAILEPAGFRYRLNITVAAIVVGMVWLAHFIVVTGLIVALLYHLIFNLDFYGTFGVAALLFHLLPSLLGAGLIALLVKPLLPVHPRTASKILLEPDQQPRLNELLKEICKQVGAPVPRHIAVDSGARITLNFGALPEVPARRPTLQLGLTLISGMSVRQFAGLLGRELGYLGRKQAARRTQFVHASHQRLREAVFGKDELEGFLKNLEKQPGARALSGRVGRKLLSLSRCLHRGLLKIVSAVAAGPLKLLQFRLDRVQAQLSGSEAFRGTLAMQHLLEMAFKAAAEEEERKWNEKGELAERLPVAALSLARERAEEFQAEIRKTLKGGIAGADESRPTDLKRIERIEKNPQQALYADDRSARQLLSGFERLSRRASYFYYRSLLLVPITPDRLSPGVVEPTRAERLLRNYLFDLHLSPVPLNQPFPEAGAETLKQQLQDAVRRSKGGQVGTRAALQYYLQIERELVEANAREVLVSAKIPLPEGKVDLESLHRECRKLEMEEEKRLKKLQDTAQAPSQRLALGLACLSSSASTPTLEEIDRFRTALRRTDEVLPKLRSLHMHATLLELLLSYNAPRNHALKDRIDERARDVSHLLLAIRVNLREAPWPFGVAARDDNMAKHAVSGDLDNSEPHDLLDIAGTALSRIQTIRQQILARLVQLSVSAEKRL